MLNCSTNLAMSTSILKALPCKLDIKVFSMSFVNSFWALHHIIVREATTIFVRTMLYWIKALVYFQRFEGNINTYSAELRQVEPPIIGKRIRFIPYCRHPRTVCMRVEIYGCQWTGNSHEISHDTLGIFRIIFTQM